MLTESEPHYRQPLLKTPFHERARALSQVDSFIAWAGYTTVDVFSFVEQEYFAIRNATTLYDLTPMVKYRIAGREAQRYLNRLMTRDIGKLKCGRVAYSVWCNDDGHLIDDGTVFRLSDTEYRLCTGERQLDWLLDSALGFDVQISEVTEETAALAVQGPTSCRPSACPGSSGSGRSSSPTSCCRRRLAPAARSWYPAPALRGIWATRCGCARRMPRVYGMR
jgi:aminomethyltransferase